MMDHDAILHAIAAHALDALAPDERIRVDRELVEHLPGCEECLRLVRELREVSGDLALGAGAVAPSPALEERILSSIREEPSSRAQGRRRPAVLRALTAAAVVALMASVGWNATLVRRADRAERNVHALDSLVRAVSDPATRSVALRGRSGGMVLYYQPRGAATLLATGLDRLPAGKVFELWLIKSGRPTPVVTFRPASATIVVPVPLDPSPYRDVAVTVEDRFVQTPTGQPVYAGSIHA